MVGVTARSFVVALAIIGITYQTAPARVASDFELSTAYCTGVMQIEAGVLRSSPDTDPGCRNAAQYHAPQLLKLCQDAEQTRQATSERLESDFERLRAYLAAKGLLIGTDWRSLAILMTYKRGVNEAQSWLRTMNSPPMKACISACPFTKPLKQWEACTTACGDKFDTDGLRAKAERCLEIVKQLPF